MLIKNTFLYKIYNYILVMGWFQNYNAIPILIIYTIPMPIPDSSIGLIV